MKTTYYKYNAMSLLLTLFAPYLTQANSSLAHKLANQYLKSFSTEESIKTKPNSNALTKKQRKLGYCKPICLSKRHACTTVFTEIFSKSKIYQAQYLNNIIHEGTWHDLHLFYGTINNLSHNFISRINKTTTILGECALCSLISAPICDITELKNVKLSYICAAIHFFIKTYTKF